MKLAGAAVIAVFLGAAIGCSEDAGQDATDGRFERVGSYLTGAHPVTSAIVDLDDDGDLDIIAPALISDDVVAVLNGGDGFEWRQLSPLPYGASHSLVFDAVGDERTELVFSNREQNRVAIYERVPGPDLVLVDELEVLGATGLEASDLDGDGDDDLVITCFNDRAIALYERTPDGLVFATQLDTGAGAYRATAADIDGDGRDELFVVAAGGNLVELFRGDLQTGFTSVASLPTPGWPSAIEVGDRDGDGALDVFGTTNQGDTIFEVSIDTGAPTWTMTSTDIDSGDGAFDLAFLDGGVVVTNKDASTVAIYDPAPTGELVLAEEFPTGDGAGPSPVTIWDFNEDGVDDLLVVNAFTDELVIYQGR